MYVLVLVFCFILQIDRKTHRPKESVPELADVLQSVKRSEFKDCHLASYKVGLHAILRDNHPGDNPPRQQPLYRKYPRR